MTTPEQAQRAAEKVLPYAIPGVMDDWERKRHISTYAKAVMDFAPWIQHDIGCGVNNIVKPEHKHECTCGLHAKLGIEP